MSNRKWLAAAVAVLLAVGSARAQERRLFGRPFCPPACDCPPGAPPNAPTDPSAPRPPADQPSANAFQEALASAGESGTQPVASYMPGFFGDIIGGQVIMQVFLAGNTFSTAVAMPNPSQSAGFKIAENESPRPTNRIYYNYNYFGNIDVGLGNPAVPRLQLSRHVVGVEKTLLDGSASVGLRIPFMSLAGDPGFDARYTGDLTVIAKAALYDDRCTGNLFSTGLVIGIPTGGTPVFPGPNGVRSVALPRLFDVNLQPFFGYIYNLGEDLYIHGFHSITVPTDRNDITFMSNDVGVGYWLYRNLEARLLQGIVPTVEIHVNTPFDHRAVAAPVFMQDQVTLTSGAYMVFARTTLGGAVGVPFNGPHTIEAVASVSLKF